MSSQTCPSLQRHGSNLADPPGYTTDSGGSDGSANKYSDGISVFPSYRHLHVHLNPQLTPAPIPSAFDPHTVEQAWSLASRWSSPLHERPGRQGPRLLGFAWVEGRRDGSSLRHATMRRHSRTVPRRRPRVPELPGVRSCARGLSLSARAWWPGRGLCDCPGRGDFRAGSGRGRGGEQACTTSGGFRSSSGLSLRL